MRRIVFVMCSLLGCAETLEPRDDLPVAPFEGEVDELGIATRRVDATNPSTYVTFDLDTGVESDEEWDVAFSRFRVKLNGGTGGEGGVFVAALPSTAIEDVTRAPEEGYTTDRPNAEDGAPGQALLAGDGWYGYDEESHVLTPRDVTYVVRTTKGAYVALRFVGYYDDAGTGGFVTFRIRAIEPPLREPELDVDGPGPIDEEPEERVLPPGTFSVDATDREAFTYLRFGSEDSVAENEDWDLGFRRTQIRTHGGESAIGAGGAAIMPSGMTFEEVASVPSDVDFAADVAIEGEMPGQEAVAASEVLSEWFDYDLMSHTVTPKDVVYLVRSADGRVAKLRIEDWRDGVFFVRIAVLGR